MSSAVASVPDDGRGGRGAAWQAAAAGWLAAQAILGSLSDRGPRALDPSLGGGDLSPRILRGWPGIGEVRALAIAEARWEHPDTGPPLYLSDVEGIGEATERAVKAWLAPPTGCEVAGGSGRGPGEGR
jgi:hypothetical protein